MRESDVEAYFVRRVEKTGGLQRKIAYVGRHSCPDRLVGWPGGPVALVELKRPKGRARVLQAREHDRLRAHGFQVDVLDTIEAVDDFIFEARGC